MTDTELIDQFFKRDLTGAEDEALERVLSASQEATDYFEDKAKTAYERYGLPEPVTPPIEPPGTKGGGWPLGKSFLLVLGVALVTALWMGRGKVQDALRGTTRPLPTISQTHDLRSVKSPGSVETSEGGDLATQGTPPPLVKKVPEKTKFQKPVAEEVIPSKLERAAESLSPVGLLKAGREGANPGYPGLRVVVDRDSPGLVTVRAVRQDGTEVQVMYAGILKAGRWAFEWDGKLKDGSKAPPGTYYIEVKSGPVLQKKEVWITK